jgi:protein-S-isoprenylcysteine O-methyltransferase Ste14
MSLIPAFEIGLWNAWVPMLYLPLHPLIMLLADKLVGTGGMNEKMFTPAYAKSEKRIVNLMMLILLMMIIYSIFLPLKLGTTWFWAGLPIYILGFVVFLIAIVNISTTPVGQIFARGMYRYSRHPMGLGMLIMNIGIGIASASWLFLIVVVALAFLPDAAIEEKYCLEKYGDTYLKYINRTPRWIGIPKSVEN